MGNDSRVEILHPVRKSQAETLRQLGERPGRGTFTVDGRYVRNRAITALQTFFISFIVILVCWAIGAVGAWSVDPGQWSGAWRLWILFWAVFWSLALSGMARRV